MRRPFKLLLVALFGTALLIGGAPSARAAGPWYVAVTGADANDCLTPATACLTIGAAIAMASAGDTINVGAGTYAEAASGSTHVLIQTADLTILGAQAGVDARTRPGTGESIIQAGANTGPGIYVGADGVTIDGFTVQGASGSAGILLAPEFSGSQVVNNIIQNNKIGLFPGSNGVTTTVIRDNLFQTNNLPGSGSGSGISSDTGLPNAVIDNNRFTGHAFMAMVLVGTQSGVTFSNNQLVTDGIEMYNTSASSITGNTISNTPGIGIYFGGGNADVDVTGNTISGSMGGAVEIDDPYGFGLNANISVLSNTLVDNAYGVLVGADALVAPLEAHFNRIVGNSSSGVQNDGALALNAENNWWGCNTGPNTTGCDVVTGAGTTIFDPWLVLTASASPTSVLTGAQAQVRASLTVNSAGIDTSSLGTVPDAIVAGFVTDLGSVSMSASHTGSGVAGTTFTAPATVGIATITATVDAASATAAVEVVAAPADPTPTPTPSPTATPAPVATPAPDPTADPITATTSATTSPMAGELPDTSIPYLPSEYAGGLLGLGVVCFLMTAHAVFGRGGYLQRRRVA